MQSMPHRSHLLIAILLFLLYLSSINGVVSSNDGSHFAATRALVRYRTLAIRDGAIFALNDAAIGTNGQVYANRPPGTALLATPAYVLGVLLRPILRQPSSPADLRWHRSVAKRLGSSLGFTLDPREMADRQVAESAQQLCCSVLSALAGVLACFLTYHLARQFGIEETSALLVIVILGTGTLIWRYSTALFSHIFSTDLLLLELNLVFSKLAVRSIGFSLLFGCVLAFGVSLEYQTILTIPVLVAYVAYSNRKQAGIVKTLGLMMMPSAIVLGALAMFHLSAFGSPFRTALTASSYLDDAGSLSNTFSGSIPKGIWFLFLAPRAFSLFSTSPILLASLGALALRPVRPRLFFIAAVAAIQTAPILIKTVPWGGLTGDHRYILATVPLIALPLGLLLDRLNAGRSKRARSTWVVYGLLTGLFIVSVFRSFQAVGLFGSHAAQLPSFQEPGVVGAYSLAELSAATFSSLDNPALLATGLAFGLPLLITGLAMMRPLSTQPAGSPVATREGSPSLTTDKPLP